VKTALHVKATGRIKQTPLYETALQVKWLALLLHIQDVPHSYLGLETSYPD
jgi:hypothetical protein